MDEFIKELEKFALYLDKNTERFKKVVCEKSYYEFIENLPTHIYSDKYITEYKKYLLSEIEIFVDIIK